MKSDPAAGERGGDLLGCGRTAGKLFSVKGTVTQKIKTRLTELLLDGDAEGVLL